MHARFVSLSEFGTDASGISLLPTFVLSLRSNTLWYCLLGSLIFCLYDPFNYDSRTPGAYFNVLTTYSMECYFNPVSQIVILIKYLYFFFGDLLNDVLLNYYAI